MTSTEDRTPGRPYPPRLDGELIVQAALELVRREGLAALTMAQLARQLEVAPSALYNHISGKDELLTRVQDEIYSGIDPRDLIGFSSSQPARPPTKRSAKPSPRA